MSKRNENRLGYKLTKVGWIPEEWSILHLRECAELLVSGVDKKIENGQRAVRLCNYNEVYRNEYITNNIDFMIASATDHEIKRFSLEKGDVVITKDSESADDIAVPSLVFENLLDVVCGYHLAIIRPNRKLLLGEYLAKLLQTQTYRHYFSTLANGVTRFGLTAQSTGAAIIALPPVEEQERIAGVLSAWDRAIEQVGSLIKAKKQLKKGLMQQLLTGRMRFPQFGQPVKEKGKLPDGWQLVRLGDAMKIIVSGVDKKAVPGQAVVNLCNYMDVYKNNYITSDLDFMQATASNNEIDKLSIKKNDVLITKDSETSDDIGVPAVVTEELKGVVCGYHLALMRPRQNGIDSVFLTQQLQLPIIKNQFTRLANGVTRFGLTTSALHRPKIMLPTRKEQTIIAKQISNLDKQIEFLTKKEAAIREQKKGLMQKLLTGEIRVKQEVTA